jgi:hypothetical protein
MIRFIHIGKTGGTTLNEQLKLALSDYKQYHHEKEYSDREKYIIWIRNPIARFVSAFNHSFYGVHVDIHKIKKFDWENCLIPARMKGSMTRSYVFSERYDELIRKFSSANELAECLYSNDLEKRDLARELMNNIEEHLFKGIGWYLGNGDFIKTNNANIMFVGRTETMREDLRSLSKILNVELNCDLKIRENVYVDESMKYLSPVAIKNVIEWYKDSDYATLEQLYNFGWITKYTLDSYYEYQHV